MFRLIAILSIACFSLSFGAQAQTAPTTQTSEIEALTLRAENGDAESQYALAFMYFQGKHVPENISESMRWAHRSAEQGNMNAQGFLGANYYLGHGVPRNYTKSVNWLSKAADQGHRGAQNLLIKMFDPQGNIISPETHGLTEPSTNSARSSRDETNPVLRELKRLRADDSAIFNKKDGWTIVSGLADKSVWFFALDNHAAAPAYVKRTTVSNDGAVSIESKIKCGASKPVCDEMVQSFIALDQQIKAELHQSKN